MTGHCEQAGSRNGARAGANPTEPSSKPRRPRPSCCCATATAGLEVLLAKRSSKLAFHGGAWVFPGGRIDPERLRRRRPTISTRAARRAAVARGEGRSRRRRRPRRARPPLELDDARDLTQAVRDVVLRRSGRGRHRGRRRRRDRRGAVVPARRSARGARAPARSSSRRRST